MKANNNLYEKKTIKNMKNREIFSEGTPLAWGKSNKQSYCYVQHSKKNIMLKLKCDTMILNVIF